MILYFTRKKNCLRENTKSYLSNKIKFQFLHSFIILMILQKFDTIETNYLILKHFVFIERRKTINKLYIFSSIYF